MSAGRAAGPPAGIRTRLPSSASAHQHINSAPARAENYTGTALAGVATWVAGRRYAHWVLAAGQRDLPSGRGRSNIGRTLLCLDPMGADSPLLGPVARTSGKAVFSPSDL